MKTIDTHLKALTLNQLFWGCWFGAYYGLALMFGLIVSLVIQPEVWPKSNNDEIIVIATILRLCLVPYLWRTTGKYTESILYPLAVRGLIIYFIAVTIPVEVIGRFI